MGTPVDELIAEIGRAGNAEAVLRLQRCLTVEVLDYWQEVGRESGECLGWDRIGADAERILRAARARRAELTAGAVE